jgi:hypothetical protein
MKEYAVDGSRPDTPEEPGLPIMYLYGPNAEITIRSKTADVLSAVEETVFRLYQGRWRLVESLETKEWAMVGSIGNDEACGMISQCHRAQPAPESLPMSVAFCQRDHETGLKTQNCDKCLDRFVRKYDPEEEMSATVAVVSCRHGDQGWAVYCTQDSRRFLLLDTVHGLTDDEALWTAMSA